MLVEHLDEAAHVRALEVVGQAHRHRDRGDGVLPLVLAVEDDDRVAQVADATWSIGIAVVGVVLDVRHCAGIGHLGPLAHVRGAGGAGFVRDNPQSARQRRLHPFALLAGRHARQQVRGLEGEVLEHGRRVLGSHDHSSAPACGAPATPGLSE